MRESPNALKILLNERSRGEFTVSAELVERVFNIEQRVQFDEARRDAPQKLREAINMALDKEALKGPRDGNAL